jgi:hypothetical protein
MAQKNWPPGLRVDPDSTLEPSGKHRTTMKTATREESLVPAEVGGAALTGSHRRTLDAIFRHPTAHNLDWRDVVAVMGELGNVHEASNDSFTFEIAGHRHVMHKPHTKDLTGEAVEELRHFIGKTGLSPEAAAQPVPAAPDLLIVVDHHGAKIFHVDVTPDEGSAHVIRPYDPHHFLHHRMHKDQSRERGQRAPEEPAFYDAIAAAVALGGRLVVVGHGAGKSNAAHHLVAYLKTHHRETYTRVVRELVADLSAITPPQLLELARAALPA